MKMKKLTHSFSGCTFVCVIAYILVCTYIYNGVYICNRLLHSIKGRYCLWNAHRKYTFLRKALTLEFNFINILLYENSFYKMQNLFMFI